MTRAVHVLVVLVTFGVGARADAAGPIEPPPATEGVGLEDRVGKRVPLDIGLREPGGQAAPLGSYFDGQTPVILVLAYVRCPMLCSLVLRGLAKAIRGLDRVPGEDFRVVTVSIDPSERASEAAAKRRELLELVERPDDPDSWQYLLGAEPEIQRLADAVGFRYRWDARGEQFAHPAAVFVLAPDRTLSSVITGVKPSPDELARALDIAAAGATGDPTAASVLSCFRFDPALRRYRERIQIYFQLGAVAVFIALAGTVFALLRRELRKRGGRR